ncbi:MAG: DinB family protein [Anaerolineae bacterium]|nr:DinB family protein [Anaerolineae bacterium]MCI0609847.1 DinB family protein [Anaerolineae bacterium]
MKKTISTDMTPANIAKVIEVLTETPQKLEALSKSLTAEGSRQPLGEGERSFTQDLAHLINGEARSSEMIYQALLTNEPVFADIHPERDWGKLLRFDLLDFQDLLVYFKIRRKVLLRVLSSLKDEGWSRYVREEGKQRKESVYWRARTIAMHELDHLGDLESKLGKK